MRVSATLALLAAAVLAATGCGDTAFGDLLVHYRLGSGGPAETCEALGISVIRVTVDNAERAPLVEDSLCSNTREEVLIRHVPADVYTVTVEGLDAEGAVAYRGSQENVTVASDSVSETREIAISVLPPGLRLIWGFADGMMCAPHHVSEIQAVAWLGGITPAYDEILDCASGLVEIELFPGTYDLRVRAIDDESGDYAFTWDRDDIVLAAGAGMVQVVASLAPCGAEAAPRPK